MKYFNILGIDQGLASCGYGVISFKRLKSGEVKFHKVLDYGVITTTSKERTPDRLVYIHNRIIELVDKYQPETIACERLFVSPKQKADNRNKSASIVTTNMVTGIVVYIAGEKNLKFRDFVPSSVKKIITGNGKAQKEDIINAIPKLMNLDEGVVKIEHQADALSIAYTAALKKEEDDDSKTKTKSKTSKKKKDEEKTESEVKDIE